MDDNVMGDVLSIMFGLLLIAALASMLYITHRVMHSQSLVDALISTGHYTDLRPAATAQVERSVLEKYSIDLSDLAEGKQK